MLKYILTLMLIMQLSEAQKSFYAGQQPWYPKVLAKYRTTTTTTTAAAPTGGETLVNRVGEAASSAVPEVSSSSPVEGQSDYEKFLQRVSSWPVDKQPFWYKNRQAISSMINQEVNGGTGQQPSSANRFGGSMRSPFAGRTRQS